MAFWKNNDYINEIIRLWFDCNEKCLFCNYIPNKDITYFKHNFEWIKKEIDKLYSRRKWLVSNVLLSFSWWEPCLWWENLFKSISYAKKLWFWYIQIQTNATIISNSFAKKLKDSWLDEAFVSLHSDNNDVLDKITLLNNSFDLTIKWIDNLKKYWINIVLSHVLNKFNYLFYSDFIEYIYKNNISKIVSLWIIQPHWESEKHLDKLLVDYNLLVPYIKKWNELAKKYDINIWLHYCSLPLCVYEKLEDNLEFEANLDFRLWISKPQNRIKMFKNDKKKLKTCEKCFYNNYCFWVWNEYIDYFWNDSIVAKKIYTDLSKNKILQNKKEKVVFYESTNDIIISNLLKEWNLLIQLIINYEDFIFNIKNILWLVKSGVNIINIVWFNSLYEKQFKLNTLILKKFSKNNYPYFDVKVNIFKENCLYKWTEINFINFINKKLWLKIDKVFKTNIFNNNILKIFNNSKDYYSFIERYNYLKIPIIENWYFENNYFVLHKKYIWNNIDKNYFDFEENILKFANKLFSFHNENKVELDSLNIKQKEYFDIKFSNTLESITWFINNYWNRSDINISDFKIPKLLYTIYKDEKIYLIHWDLNINNILIDNDNLFFIDFESTRFFDYYYDIAYIKYNIFNNDEVLFDKFLNFYFNENWLEFNLERLTFMEKFINLK